MTSSRVDDVYSLCQLALTEIPAYFLAVHRERSTRLSTLEEPRASTRGATATIARQQSTISTKEATDDNHLKVTR